MTPAYVRAAATALAALALAGCSLVPSGQEGDRGTEPTGGTEPGGTVVLATHLLPSSLDGGVAVTELGWTAIVPPTVVVVPEGAVVVVATPA